jgi:hypothetical protein
MTKIKKEPEHDGYGERWHILYTGIEYKNGETIFRTFDYYKYRNGYEEFSSGRSIMLTKGT